jgi:thiol-disulfide isomerase/thioredoxin
MRLPVLAVLLLLTATPVLAKSERPQSLPQGIVAGAQAPNFTLKDLQGNPVTLSKLRGKVVFLNFWATWCPPCRAELPSMERLNEVYGSRDFVMLAVNVEEDAGPVREFLAKNRHSFRVLLDPGADAQADYGVYRFPETFLIDKKGKVVERYVGARDWSAVDFLKKVDALTKE